MTRVLRSKFSPIRTKRPKRAGACRRPLRMEMLEQRRLLSVTPTYMNDNWHLVTDIGDSGPSLGDTVSSINDPATPAFPGVITATYGVNAFGRITTPSPGSSSLYDEIQEALSNTSSGGTLHFLPGLYTPSDTIVITEPVSLNGPQAGIDPRPSNGSARIAGSATEAVIDGGAIVNGTILRIEANNVAVNGLEFRNSPVDTGDMIESLQSAPITAPSIRYSIIHHALGDEAVQLRSATSALIEYNHIYETTGDGINLSADSNGGTIRYNEVHDINSLDAAIYVSGSTGVTIQGNRVYNSFNNDGIKLGSNTGADATKSGGLIENNIVHDVFSGGDGITVYMSGVTVRGNEVYNTHSYHGAIFVQYAVDNVTIVDNHVHDNRDPAPGGDQGAVAGIKIGRSNDTPVFVAVLNNRIVNNDWGILVNRGTALIENNDLTGNFVGIRVERGALVDAGSIDDPGDGNSNPTGRTVGSDSDGSSRGLNVLTGYTGVVGNYAIENLNRDLDGHPNVKAENNFFGTADLNQIALVVYDDADDPSRTVVDFVPPAILSRIIDNGQSGYAEGGSGWGSILSGGFNNNYRTNSAGTGADTATWTFSGVVPGLYRVAATWVPFINRATDAPFTVFDGPAPFETVLVNQELTPDDFNDAGAAWENLGGLYPIASSTLVVRLTDAANEYVIADAIRIERVGDLPPSPPGASDTIVDNGTVGYTEGGSGWGSILSGGFNNNYRTNFAGTGSDVATWTFTGLSSGVYRVSATWVPYINRATNSPFTVRNGAAPFKTMQVNQELAPDDFSANGVNWEVLGGLYPITSGTLTVQLTDAANEFVIADAVRIQRVGDLPGSQPTPTPSLPIIDNRDPGYFETGDWGTIAGGFQGDYRTSMAGSGNDVARWVYTGLSAGLYRVSATWVPYYNRATDAPFTVYDGASVLATVRVNQELAPDDRIDAGANWEDLGGLYPITTGLLAVVLADAANEYVIADAVRIERVGNLPTPPPGLSDLVIDNGATGYAETGNWGTIPVGGFQGSYRTSGAGSGSDVASWTFNGLSSGLYRVSATWVPYVNRATNSPFTVRDGSQPFKTLLVNQEQAPDDFVAEGATWDLLGGLYPISSGTLKVELSDAANEYVIADAIRVERVGDLPAPVLAPTLLVLPTASVPQTTLRAHAAGPVIPSNAGIGQTPLQPYRATAAQDKVYDRQIRNASFTDNFDWLLGDEKLLDDLLE